MGTLSSCKCVNNNKEQEMKFNQNNDVYKNIEQDNIKIISHISNKMQTKSTVNFQLNINQDEENKPQDKETENDDMLMLVHNNNNNLSFLLLPIQNDIQSNFQTEVFDLNTEDICNKTNSENYIEHLYINNNDFNNRSKSNDKNNLYIDNPFTYANNIQIQINNDNVRNKEINVEHNETKTEIIVYDNDNNNVNNDNNNNECSLSNDIGLIDLISKALNNKVMVHKRKNNLQCSSDNVLGNVRCFYRNINKCKENDISFGNGGGFKMNHSFDYNNDMGELKNEVYMEFKIDGISIIKTKEEFIEEIKEKSFKNEIFGNENNISGIQNGDNHDEIVDLPEYEEENKNEIDNENRIEENKKEIEEDVKEEEEEINERKIDEYHEDKRDESVANGIDENKVVNEDNKKVEDNDKAEDNKNTGKEIVEESLDEENEFKDVGKTLKQNVVINEEKKSIYESEEEDKEKQIGEVSYDEENEEQEQYHESSQEENEKLEKVENTSNEEENKQTSEIQDENKEESFQNIEEIEIKQNPKITEENKTEQIYKIHNKITEKVHNKTEEKIEPSILNEKHNITHKEKEQENKFQLSKKEENIISQSNSFQEKKHKIFIENQINLDMNQSNDNDNILEQTSNNDKNFDYTHNTHISLEQSPQNKTESIQNNNNQNIFNRSCHEKLTISSHVQINKTSENSINLQNISLPFKTQSHINPTDFDNISNISNINITNNYHSFTIAHPKNKSLKSNIYHNYKNKIKDQSITSQQEDNSFQSNNPSDTSLDKETKNNFNTIDVQYNEFLPKQKQLVINCETIQTNPSTITNPLTSHRNKIYNNNQYQEQIETQLYINLTSSKTNPIINEQIHLQTQQYQSTINNINTLEISSNQYNVLPSISYPKHSYIPTAHQIEENTFTLLSSNNINKETSLIQNKEFNNEIVITENTTNSKHKEANTIDVPVRASQTKQRTKLIRKNKKKATYKPKQAKLISNIISQNQTKSQEIKNKFFKDVLIFSLLKKLNINKYDIKYKDNNLYSNRFCALKEKQFEYYTSNENFILLQKPTCVIKNEDIKQVKVVSLFQLFGKGYSKKKNHFMIKYVVKDKKNNLNNINMNDNDVDDVVFTAANEEVVMKWVLLLNRVILYNEV